MALLHFKGKSAIWNHHLSVPYHTLEKDEKKSLKGEYSDENLIIEGDNLLALKSLLPQYQGKVKCIYIDPPYNTGNEGWVYNDSVNSPTMKEWVGKVVGGEGEDLTRHDKWLCMMAPRLRLLKELLSDDGVIFVSIDDNEVQHLRMLLDEVFGEDKFVATFVWKRRASSSLADKLVSQDHEYVLCYHKGEFLGFSGNGKDYSAYSNPDNDPDGDWTLGDLTVGMTKDQRPNQFYDLIDPKTGRVFQSNPKRVWTFIPESMEKEIKLGHIVFPANDDGRPMYKRFKKNLKGATNPISTWIRSIKEKNDEAVYSIETGLNSEGTKILQEIFTSKVFDYPKPVSLVENLLKQVVDSNSIVLDSFAGTGTTAHAVLNLNKEDGGNRKFILVEMEKYANSITAERVRKTIKNLSVKTGFTYSTLGPAIDAESILAGKLPTYTEFAKYVYYLASGKNHLNQKEIEEKEGFVGKTEHESIYLLYEQDISALRRLAITLDWARNAHEKNAGKKIVYAPACYLDEEHLDEFNIKFVSIPYNLFERN